ncbi:MAG: MATE family efflux transporter [Candidatus Omnitrophica bacterium]|nr:MATE family efflux transporter [Candidatus Omnitrophota bacterium]
MREKNNLTEGPILQSLLTISLPIIFANFLHTAYQLTDTFWVGRLGTAAIAAVSISFPVIFLIVAMGGGLSIAGTILVAQYKGKNDKRAVDHVTAQTLLTVFTVSAALACIGFFLSPHVIRLLGAEKEVFASAVSYMKISFAGIIFMFTFMVFQSLMRGVGDVKTPMYIILGTVLLNLIVDPLFIMGYGFVPAMGVSGAALATIVSQGIAAVIGMYLMLRKKRQIHLHLRDMKPDFPLIKKMLALGMPSSVEHSTVALGMNFIIFLVTGFGTTVLAAYGIGHRIFGFVIIPTLGLSMATSALVGQNIGAGKIERAERIVRMAVSVGFVTLTLIGVLMFLFAEQLSAIFIPGEFETIRMSAQFLRIMALTFGFIGIHHVLNGAFIGSGNTFTSMALSIISLWLLRFPLSYFLSRHTGLREMGIWIAFPATNVLTALITAIWFSRGTWKKRKITEEIKLVAETTEEALIEEGLNP